MRHTAVDPSGGMSLQAGLDIGDGLGRIGEEDGVDAQVAGGGTISGRIVEKDHLVWRDTKPLAGHLEDVCVGLGHALLMRVDDEITHLVEVEASALLTPGTDEAIAEESGLVARAQGGEVVGKLDVEVAAIDIPEVAQEGV